MGTGRGGSVSSSRELSHSTTDGQGNPALAASEVALTDVEWRVLDALSWGNDEYCFSLRTIAGNAGLHRELTRGALRALADRGLARFERGLMTEDGELAGSGYGITKAGAHAFWNHLRDEAGNCTASTLGNSGRPA